MYRARTHSLASSSFLSCPQVWGSRMTEMPCRPATKTCVPVWLKSTKSTSNDGALVNDSVYKNNTTNTATTATELWLADRHSRLKYHSIFTNIAEQIQRRLNETYIASNNALATEPLRCLCSLLTTELSTKTAVPVHCWIVTPSMC